MAIDYDADLKTAFEQDGDEARVRGQRLAGLFHNPTMLVPGEVDIESRAPEFICSMSEVERLSIAKGTQIEIKVNGKTESYVVDHVDEDDGMSVLVLRL